MPLTKRIIPCLDIKDGQTVKGIQFEQLTNQGDPVSLAADYAAQGADELVFLDITATHERRKTLPALVRRIAATINIPFTVGGGISAVADVYALLAAGADKVSVNTATVRQPKLIYELAREFGSQCIVVAIDTKRVRGEWKVYLQGGTVASGRHTIDWAVQAAAIGAGEILLTCIDQDGMKNGFAVELTRMVSQAIHIPLIASGGAGTPQHFADVLTDGAADAALAAGVFHQRTITIPDLKQFLNNQDIPVRL